MSMKHLLAGVAMAATLAIAAPVWAQTSTAPAGGAAGERTPTRTFMHQQVHNPTASPSAASSPAAERMSTRRYMHHVVHRNRQEHGMSAAEQLNAQELQRIQAGAPPAPPPMTQ
jgi:hypothetical protein